MDRLAFRLMLLLPLTLSGCSLEPFEIQPCELGGSLGFRIEEIDGWFSDYQPRPVSVLIRADDNLSYREPPLWETHLKYFGPGDRIFESRPARKLITYGQRFPGWTLDQAPRALMSGQKYWVHISDGGHDGDATFEVGKTLPAC